MKVQWNYNNGIIILFSLSWCQRETKTSTLTTTHCVYSSQGIKKGHRLKSKCLFFLFCKHAFHVAMPCSLLEVTLSLPSEEALFLDLLASLYEHHNLNIYSIIVIIIMVTYGNCYGQWKLSHCVTALWAYWQNKPAIPHYDHEQVNTT